MIAPALSPNTVTYVILKWCLRETTSEHDGAMHLVFVSSECPDILVYPFQRCQLISQTEIEDPSFIGWFRSRQRTQLQLDFRSPCLPSGNPRGPRR